MRILKKSLALLLALTIIASLVVVNVSAADAIPTVKYTLKYNGAADAATAYKTEGFTSVAFDIYFSSVDEQVASMSVGTLSFKVQYPDWVLSATFEKNATDYPTVVINPQGTPSADLIGCGVVAMGAPNTIYADKKLGTITLNFDAATVAEKSDLTLTLNAATAKASDLIANETVDMTSGGYVLTLADAVEITGLKTPVTIADKKVGTAQGDLGLPTTVTTTAIKVINDAAAADIEDVAVAWTGYDPLALTAQTLTGTLTDPDGDGEGVSIASDAVIQATVTLLPLGTDDTTVTITVDEEKLTVREGEAKTADEVAAIVKDAITKIEFAGNGLTREISKDNANINFNKTDIAVAGTEEVDETIGITVEFNDVDSEDGIFDGIVTTDATTVSILIVKSYTFGDVNNDGVIDYTDVGEVIAHIAAEFAGSSYDFIDSQEADRVIPAEVADVSGDFKTSSIVIDYTDVGELIAHIAAEFAGSEYEFEAER